MPSPRPRESSSDEHHGALHVPDGTLAPRDVVRPDWVVLKVAQRCNINCSYCYVYNRGDETWRERPTFISRRVLTALARRIVETYGRGGARRFVIELHGGEPLLLGKQRMIALIEQLREECVGI